MHERFASALYPIAFVMIVVALIGQAQTTRQGRTQSVVIGFIVASAARIGGFAAMNLLTLKASAIWLVYAIPVLSFLAALALAKWRMTPRLGRLQVVSRLESIAERWRTRPRPAGAARGYGSPRP